MNEDVDIVDRLRGLAGEYGDSDAHVIASAANEIENLRHKLSRARHTLALANERRLTRPTESQTPFNSAAGKARARRRAL
jgi:hypothetical protein